MTTYLNSYAGVSALTAELNLDVALSVALTDEAVPFDALHAFKAVHLDVVFIARLVASEK